MKCKLVRELHLTAVSLKDEFYGQLDIVKKATPMTDKLFPLGHFNARVGRNQQIWEGVIEKEGVGNLNFNGLLQLRLCAENHLCVTNTIF